jgi:hypothetical protein
MRVRSLRQAAILLCLCTGAAGAQTTVPSPYRFWETRQEAGPFVGWISPGTGQFGYGPKSGPLVGVRYELGFPGPLSVEVVADYIPTTRDVMDPRRVEGDRRIGESDVKLLDVNGRLKLSLTGARTWHRINPFVLAGAGVMWDLAGTSAPDNVLGSGDRFSFGTKFAGQVGGGIRLFANDHWIARTDALLHVWKLQTPAGFRDASRGFGSVGTSEWVNASSISLGVGYRF